MAGWTRHEGRAAGLAMENVDTDQLIPARFMSAPRSEGYGRFLLHDLRADGLSLSEGATVIVARRNFGCGSSREAAVYALVDYGIRAVIAPSFGDIFAGNAVNNGLLPAQVTEDEAERLLALAPSEVSVDIEAGEIVAGGERVTFALDPVWRTKIVNGWDDIDLTASHSDQIEAFRERRAAAAPWAWPRRQEGEAPGRAATGSTT